MPKVLLPKSDLIHLSIHVDGKALPDDIQILSVYCETGFNLLPMLELGLSGPSGLPANGVAPWLETLGLKTGSTIEVKAGYDEDLATIFKGNFMGLTLGLDDELSVVVVVDAISPVFKLDLEMDIYHFENITLKDLLKKLSREEGFSLQEDLEENPADDIYFEGTAWELLLEIAEENDRVVIVENDAIQVTHTKANTIPVGIVEAGENLLDFEFSIDAFSEGEKERFGEIAIPGTTQVGLNDFIEIKGVGKSFDGKALVVSITHDLADGQWETVLGVMCDA